MAGTRASNELHESRSQSGATLEPGSNAVRKRASYRRLETQARNAAADSMPEASTIDGRQRNPA